MEIALPQISEKRSASGLKTEKHADRQKVYVNHRRLTVAMIMYIFPPNYGGRAVQALQVAKALRQIGVDSFFVAANLADAPDFEIMDGSPVYRFRTVSTPRFDYLIYMLKVLSLLFKKRNTYDVIHFHSIKPFSFLITGMAKLFGKPTLISLSLIGNDDPHALKSKSFLWALEAKMYKRLDRLNCESTALKESCLQENIAPEKISSIPCGVDEKTFVKTESALERKNLRKALGLPEKAFICLFVGRISTRKGCDLLFDAWDMILKNNNNDLYLVLVGPYGDHLFMKEEQRKFDEQVQKYARSAAQHKMQFKGKVEIEEIARYFKAVDCFVFPSRTEGFGIVTIEAMACGVPVIATRIQGVTEDIITHREDGIILEEREPAALVAAIQELQNNKKLHAKISQNAVRKVNRYYTISLVAAQHAHLYKQLILSKEKNKTH